MTERYDRRAFLRRVTALGFAAPTVSMLACSPDDGRSGDEGPRPPDRSITRPVLLPWADDAVRIRAPLSELPVAYVSRGLRRIYIGLDSRIEVSLMLAAHISVSTALWRIPLPGDDLRVGVVAGDELREFEETHIGEWDARRDPKEGDFRVRRGLRENVEVAFDCLPMASRPGWYSAGPWQIEQCTGRGPELCREDFVEIGTGSHYTDRAMGRCAGPTDAVRYLTWAAPTSTCLSRLKAC